MKNSAARKLKQVPAGYLTVGVDPYKRRHAAVAMTQDFMVQGKFKFANSKRGFEEALDERGIPFRLINQFTLKRRREGKELNRRKNDFRDAEVAAQLLCTGEFTETKLPQGVYAELRATYSAYRR